MAALKKERFIKALDERILILDGAMGTRLMDQGVSIGSGLDSANLDAPGVVQAVHRDYVSAGVDILITNTFGANTFRLAKHGLVSKIRRINRQGVMLARGVAQEEHFVAGSMGPIGKPVAPIGKIPEDKARLAFKGQAEALIEADLDLIILETFTDLHEIRLALGAVLGIDPDMPVVASMTFTDEGKTIYGFKPEECARILMEEGAVAVGANCSSGPAHLHEVVDRMHRVPDVRVFVSPNAGLPAYVDGRYVYLTGPDYFAQQARQFVRQGVRGFGGCCGTGPEHIRAIRAAIGGEKPVFGDDRVSTDLAIEVVGESDETRNIATSLADTSIAEKIEQGQFIVSVEIDPPKSISPDRMIQGAALLKQAGVDAINVADSPLARARMSPLALSILIQQQVDIEIILHMSCRDRNVLGLQAELMGSHALGVRNILAVTGDPPSMGDCPDATGVFDVDAIGLLSVIKHLNEGTDLVGKPLKFKANFFGGCASNPTSDDLNREIRRFGEKVSEGALFTMTQPLYEAESLERFLNATKCTIPVLVGILPLRNFRHASFLHNEVPGMNVPQEIRERMKAAGEDGPKEGVAIAREYLERVKPMVQGVYLMPPFNRFEMAVEVIDGLV